MTNKENPLLITQPLALPYFVDGWVESLIQPINPILLILLKLAIVVVCEYITLSRI